MINFTSAPAFGFETATCNAVGHYIKKRSQRQLETMKGQLGIVDLTVKPKLQKAAEDYYSEWAITAWKASNVVKVLGYIPLIGTFLGLSRILEAALSTKEDLPNRYNHIARGCVELLSLGFLLVIPDLILTGCRAYNAEKKPVYLW
jgi:hypothetical protein